MIFLLLLAKVLGFCTEPPKSQLVHSRRLQAPPVEETEFTPISIYIQYETTSNSQVSKQLQEDYIPAAVNFYSKVLSVKKTQSKLVPEANDCLGTELSPRVKEGVESDVVVVFSYQEQGEYSAWGQVCEVSVDEYMRPLVGKVFLQGQELETYTWEQMYALVVHEIAHILVFNYNLLGYFRGEVGETLGIYNVLGSYVSEYGETEYIKSEKVLETAKSAFDCYSFPGLNLETENSGSLFHWEKTLMFNDFMVADSDIYYVVFSDVSFALFEDSGWYRVNYEYTDSVVWGYKAGCNFVNKPCFENGLPTSEFFCNSTKASSYCDHTHTFKGMCDLGSSQRVIPPRYQYFSDPYTAGKDQNLNYCPVVKPFVHGNCKKDAETDKSYGEEVCENCRCVEGTYGGNYQAGCHKVTCMGSVATVHVGEEIARCTPEGGPVTVRGYPGYLVCPPSDILCRTMHCIENCHGRGKCLEGKCRCDEGFYGEFCQNSSYAFGVGIILMLLS
mmetsp:Transcript_14199/g.20755  ORF Transcript_14199/g.20755 Transcript_14199/m.20755 type:complete len:501 (+) Transcript_14199:1008-2510(+)